MCTPPTPEAKGRGEDTLLRVRGWKRGRSQFGRLEKKTCTLVYSVNLVVILLVELVADLAGALVAESLLVSAGGENAHVLAVPVVLGAGVE